jgi:hypothetical protein
MNLTINVDLAKILTPTELRNYVLNMLPRLQTNDAPAVSTVEASNPVTRSAIKVPTPEGGWEYAPQLGKRRSRTDIALHKQEISLGRRLTPQEKGETDAHIELDTEAEAQAKEHTKTRARIEGITAEANEAAAEELANEADTEQTDDYDPPIEPTIELADIAAEIEKTEEVAKIPKADDLKQLDSLFSQ